MRAPHTDDLERFRALVTDRLGLHFDDAKLSFLSEVLSRWLDRPEYAQLCALDPPARRDRSSHHPALTRLAEELTVSETFFFRNREQFEVLTEIAVPRLLDSKADGAPLRILSAGCSSGEEPYSVAMSLADSFPDIPPDGIRIDAVDISPYRIERAVRGSYPVWSMRDTPEAARAKWFKQVGPNFRIDQRVRDRVTFRVGNLAEDGSLLDLAPWYDVVYCRNVLMYFAPEAARALVERIQGSLVDGGYLFLGHAESLRELSSDFELHHTDGAFYYVRSRGKESVDRLPHLRASRPRARAAPPAPRSPTVWPLAIRESNERIQALAGRLTPAAPVEPDGARRADLREEIGRVGRLIRSESYQQALDELDELRASAPRDPEVQMLRAIALVHRGLLDAAEQACHSLLAIDESQSGAHYLMALCSEAKGSADRAAEHDLRSAHWDPTFAMPRLHLGLLLRKAGRERAANEELARARSLLHLENADRIALYGGGFGREVLLALCHSELNATGGAA